MRPTILFINIVFGAISLLEAYYIYKDPANFYNYLLLFLCLTLIFIFSNSVVTTVKSTNKKSPHVYHAKYTYTFDKDSIIVTSDDEARYNTYHYYYDRILKVVSYEDYLIIYPQFNQLLVMNYKDLVQGEKSDLILYLNYALNDRIHVIEK